MRRRFTLEKKGLEKPFWEREMPFLEGRFFRQTETLEAWALESLASTHLSNFIEMTLINS